MALAYRCADTAVADYCQTSSSLKRPLDQSNDPFGYVGDTAKHWRRWSDAQRILKRNCARGPGTRKENRSDMLSPMR
jgi:hypothetical protein